MKHKISISCCKDNLLKIRHFVNDVLQKHLVPEVEAHKIILAVDEVCANLIIHSNQCNGLQKLDVTVDFPEGQKKIIFLIKDEGISFNYNLYEEPTIDEIISSRKKGGVGLMLVKRIMDKIEFSQEKNRNICKLTKKIGS